MDYLRIDVTETTWVFLRVVSDRVRIDGALLDSGGNPIQTATYRGALPDGRMNSALGRRLDRGTYYLRMSGSAGTGTGTGTYVVRLIEDTDMERVVTECSASLRPVQRPAVRLPVAPEEHGPARGDRRGGHRRGGRLDRR